MKKYKPVMLITQFAEVLIGKIEYKIAKVGVIVLDYVGLPLAVDDSVARYSKCW